MRDLQKEEYTVIKAIEDLKSLSTDVKDILQNINMTEEELKLLQVEYEALKASKNSIEEEYSLLLENPLLSPAFSLTQSNFYRPGGIRTPNIQIWSLAL